jgi:hypothetical protein
MKAEVVDMEGNFGVMDSAVLISTAGIRVCSLLPDPAPEVMIV